MPVSNKRPAAKTKAAAQAARKPQTVRQGTVDAVEQTAYELLKSVFDKAFELDGLRGALTVAHGVTMEYDRIAGVAESDPQAKGDEKLLKGIAALHIVNEVVPSVLEGIAELEREATASS